MTTRPAVMAVCAVALAASACSTGSSGGRASVSSSPTTRQLDENANGSSVQIHPGDTIVVVLHSTYWAFDVPGPVLQPVGEPQPSPSHCAVAGSGCGTVTATYKAGHVGQTRLRAHRDSCGEALRCSASESDWSVTVSVT